MELLILGLILIFLLVVQLYMMNKEQESFVSEAEKQRNTEERTFLKKQDQYWDIRKQGIGSGLLVSKPGINTWLKLKNNEFTQFIPKVGSDQTLIDKGVTNCRALTKCSGLGNNNCGYCAFDKEFRFGDNKGPSANVCPKDAWTTDAKKCQELREKEICANVKSCGDLYGEAEKICGYCPTTGVAMAMRKAGNKYIPKYSDDVCNAEGFGLLPGNKCGKFLKDHPCITPYYLSGPHSTACVEKLWKNSNCTDKTPYGKTYEELGKAIKMPYKQAGVIMQNTNAQTRSTDYKTAVSSSDLCFGNHDNVDPCDQKYSREGIPNPACLRREYKEAGCVEKGTGWKELIKDTWSAAKVQVGQVNKYAKNLVGAVAVAGGGGSIVSGNIVKYNGKEYRVLSGNWPGHFRQPENSWLKYPRDCDAAGWDGHKNIPTGWVVAPDDKDSIYVIKNYPWRTHVLTTANGQSYGTANYQSGVKVWSNGLYRSGSKVGCTLCWCKVLLMKKSNDTTTASNYKKIMKRVNDLTVEADDYPTRLSTSMQCYGIKPTPPPPMKAGDTVLMNKKVEEGKLKFEGIITQMEGNICKIMWTSTFKNGAERKRENMSQDDQKKYLGWPGLPPEFNVSLPAEFNKGRLNLKKSCSNDRSVCDRTCTDIIRAVEYKYPRPRDCIVGEWQQWMTCSKACAGGFQDRLRPVLYPAKFGGKPCPTLTTKRVCNTFPCMNPNFFKK